MSRKSGTVNTRIPVLLRQHAEHAEMLAASRFGADDTNGSFAVLVNAGEQKSGDVYETAQIHALQLTERETALRGVERVILLENPTTQVALEVIADPSVSSLAFVGHGSLGSFRSWNQGDEQLGWLSWHHLLPAMDHLKTGTVEQRTCVGLNKKGQVAMPLGTFIVADQTKITTPPPGSNVPNSAGFDEFNALLSPPFSSVQGSVAELISNTGQCFTDFLPQK